MTDNNPTRHEPAGQAWAFLFAAWLLTIAATLGALFIGEVMGQMPCDLCWHQRVFMFPLTVVLGVACLRSDAEVWRYALPVSLIGGLIAAFHSLLYLGFIPEAIEPCSATGPSCAGADMTILGGLPLPLLSFAAFAGIVLLLLLARRKVV